VIAGRHGNDAAAALFGREGCQAIERTALLVGRGKLQVLELEPDFAAVLRRQRAAVIAGGGDVGALDYHCRALDIRKGHIRLHIARVLHSIP
jgi:hypothetical protein